jgi:hypothetical protein
MGLRGCRGLNGYDKIIIGPCDFPEISRQAMRELMVQAEMQSPDEKLIVSGIPLRNF